LYDEVEARDFNRGGNIRTEDMTKDELVDEVNHFMNVSSLALQRKEHYPRLENIDYFAAVEPYKGCVGGDHIIIVNFYHYHIKDRIIHAREQGKDRLVDTLVKNLYKIGILIADVSGHMITDHVTVNYLDAAFRTGVAYELKHNGEITGELFEYLNTIFYNRLTPEYLRSKPFITLMYGEIASNGRFRYLSAGHPPPIIFSREFDRIMQLSDDDTKSSTPLGMLPSKYSAYIEQFGSISRTKEKYSANEINLLGKGDIMILYTDGLSEQNEGQLNFVESRLEQVLREVKDENARTIYTAIKKELHKYYPPDDDLAMAVIKKK
jgi:serine phosphatase RsbU (regulator of sigma subunit)